MPTGAPSVRVTESDLSYILYTSGSTGTPKGVVHTHASGLSWARGTTNAYALRSTDRLSSHAPLHFDLSTFDYFASALVGATTVIVPEIYTKLPASFSSLIASEHLSVVYAVPYAFVQLLKHGAIDKRDLRALRWVLFAGEPFPPRLLRALMAAWPHARFSNIYGPTEVNGVTYHIVPETFIRSSDDSVPIGNPYAFASAMVMDEDGQPVEPGTAGELWVRSDTAMQGYWGRPDLNATAFVQHEGESFYRTGDLVRQRDDGVYVFLGRKDRQIKTRGHRVELAEVEAVLSKHEAVDAVAAFTVPDSEGSHRILAAVSVQPGAELAMSALREFAFARLHAYAVPEAIALLNPFPRTPTGKVDRLAAQDLATRNLVTTDSE
jgi:amino acid adenylation domain-containing protein